VWTPGAHRGAQRVNEPNTAPAGSATTAIRPPSKLPKGSARRLAVAVIARGAGRVDARSAVEREGVTPERHLLDGRASDVRIDLDRQQVGHLPLGLGDDAPALRYARRDRNATEPFDP
jgi:hypothetical protein